MASVRDAAKLILRSLAPLNAEPTLRLLASTPITAQDAFFIRSHGNVPELDPATHLLHIRGRVANPLAFTLDELRQNFPGVTVTAAILCAGNRREEMNSVDAVAGTKWEQGAIGNAEWTGVRLADVLRAAAPAAGDLHVAFSSADKVTVAGMETSFGGSIPLAKALSPEVLIAFAMNGEPLTPSHGFPMRIIVPGYIGARSVKWLSEISVQDSPSENYFQQSDYRLFPGVGSDGAEASGVMLGELPVNSAFLSPREGGRLRAGTVSAEGYALVGGGRTIERVDVSADGGATWRRARLQCYGRFAWTLWRAEVEVRAGPAELVVRAWDSSCQTQPERLETVWNEKGYMNTAWHRIFVTVR